MGTFTIRCSPPDTWTKLYGDLDALRKIPSEYGFMKISMVEIATFVKRFLTLYTFEGLEENQKWNLVIQGMGRFTDVANRFDSIMYPKMISVWGSVKVPESAGWLTMRGSKCSRSLLVKYATSLDAGNLLKAIAVQRGHYTSNRKGDNQALIKTKLTHLVKAMKKLVIHPAQKYFMEQVLVKSNEFNRAEVMTFVNSLLVAKPKRNVVFAAPIAYWDPKISAANDWKDQIVMYDRRRTEVFCSFPQMPVISMMMCPYEDERVFHFITGVKMMRRKGIGKPSAIHIIDHPRPVCGDSSQ